MVSGWHAPLLTRLLCSLAVLTNLVIPTGAVKQHDFKKCDQSGFCKRNRAYADGALESAAWRTPYDILADSASFKDGKFEAVVLKSVTGDAGVTTVRLPITISFHESGTARVTIDEEKRQKKEIELRHDSNVRKERYNEAEQWVIVGGTSRDSKAKVAYQDKTQTTVKYGPSSSFEAVIKYRPFAIDFKRDGDTQIKFNDQGLLNVDHWRPKIDKPEKKEGEEGGNTDGSTGEDESTWWDETFGGNTDTKPRGPESVALDITFVDYEHVFGIPSHTGPLSLKETRGGGDGRYEEPYRMYNADVFEYILDSPMTLYGSIPFMQAHRKDSSVGVFWLNAAETWVDIRKQGGKKNALAIGTDAKTSTHTHWISESGLLDVFVFLGPTPHDLAQKYGELTGYTAMPQEFAIGYHQCRWNYVSDQDVLDVDAKMDKHQIPYDVIWLDIEYTEEKKYFTWDKNTFPDPIGMGKKLDDHGRKLVTIIDPHIKNTDGYDVVSELKAKDLGAKNKDGQLFEGWCWPGSSHWIDCFNPAAREWWKTLFKYDRFKGSMENTFIWNDMNEPSVFNGPETTMPKDNMHHGGWEHRDVHNLNGMTFHNATYHALLSRKADEQPRRPFVLTRSFFAGSQRSSAMWTGDNQAAWDHLAASMPMVLSQGVAGFPFAGADVGGFFGNPDKELQTRWYQAGAFYPFFRGHAHIDARRREPYLAGAPYSDIITAALRLRYSLLPSWYTAFRRAHVDGAPIVRPMFYTHPAAEAGFGLDDQFFVGGTGLLCKPVTEAGRDAVDVWIPDDEVYYDYFTYDVVATKAAGKRLSVAAPLDKIPLLMRGGHVFARRDVPRRSSALMRWDDYTLVVAAPATKGGEAAGELYVDDGDSFDYEKGQFVHREFAFDGNVLRSKDAAGDSVRGKDKDGPWLAEFKKTVGVAKVMVVGAPAAWAGKKTVKVKTGDGVREAILDYVAADKGGKRAAYAIVRGLGGVKIAEDWEIRF